MIPYICIPGLMMQYPVQCAFYRLGLICRHGWCCILLIPGEALFCFPDNQWAGS
jgi:hypothetical protein